MRKQIIFSFRVPYYFLKTYLDAKFQLIWPSNKARNKKDTLLKNQVSFLCVCLGYGAAVGKV